MWQRGLLRNVSTTFLTECSEKTCPKDVGSKRFLACLLSAQTGSACNKVATYTIAASFAEIIRFSPDSLRVISD